MWRRFNGADWKFGRDVGYGYGWRVMAGALLPVGKSEWLVDRYRFTDSSGAEYRPDVNTGGVWTSKEAGAYMAHDSNSRRLYFPDGSFWKMEAESRGKEEDAGTLYPVVMQDTHGTS